MVALQYKLPKYFCVLLFPCNRVSLCSHYVVQAGPEFSIQLRLGSNSWQSYCFSLQSTGITSMLASKYFSISMYYKEKARLKTWMKTAMLSHNYMQSIYVLPVYKHQLQEPKQYGTSYILNVLATGALNCSTVYYLFQRVR